jgi:uncharacterized protein YqhQ
MKLFLKYIYVISKLNIIQIVFICCFEYKINSSKWIIVLVKNEEF